MNVRIVQPAISIPALPSAILALLLWSGAPIANKVATGFMDGLTAGVLRSLLAGILAMGVAVVLRLPFPRDLPDRLLLLVSGISSFAVWPIAMSVGIARTTVGHAALIMALTPVFTVLISSTLQGRFPKFRWWVGTAIALCATTILIVGRGLSLRAYDDGSRISGDLMILAGGMICSLGYVTGGRLASRIGAIATTFWGLSASVLALAPLFGAICKRTVWTDVPARGWFAIAWMAILSSLVGYALWFYALGRGGIEKIGSLQLAMPVMTVTLAACLLGEPVTALLAGSGLSLVLGTFLAQRSAA